MPKEIKVRWGWLKAIIFATYIIGDLIAIPLSEGYGLGFEIRGDTYTLCRVGKH